MVDNMHSKCIGINPVPVRVRHSAPNSFVGLVVIEVSTPALQAGRHGAVPCWSTKISYGWPSG
jgi:hypothetical protein